MTDRVKKYLELTEKLQEFIAQDNDTLIDQCLDELDVLWYAMTEEELDYSSHALAKVYDGNKNN